MVEERKSAGDLNNNMMISPSGMIDTTSGGDPAANAEYADLMDLIYSGGDDGEPTVMEEQHMLLMQ